MPDNAEADVMWAVSALIDNARHLPPSLAAELREYYGDSGSDGPGYLLSQRYACMMLLSDAAAIPDPLEAELGAYLRQLDHALGTPRSEPEMTDSAAMDAVSGILRSSRRGQTVIEEIRDIARRSGRGATSQREAPPMSTVTNITGKPAGNPPEITSDE
jgi:hypothetical protein